MTLRELPLSHAALRFGAASCVLTDRDEVKGLMARLLEIDPTLRVSSFSSQRTGNQHTRQKYADVLRKAGLPE